MNDTPQSKIIRISIYKLCDTGSGSETAKFLKSLNVSDITIYLTILYKCHVK